MMTGSSPMRAGPAGGMGSETGLDRLRLRCHVDPKFCMKHLQKKTEKKLAKKNKRIMTVRIMDTGGVESNSGGAVL